MADLATVIVDGIRGIDGDEEDYWLIGCFLKLDSV
jgi:hypothetical protein